MLFNSFEFIAFFVVVYSLYLIFSHQWQNRLLIVASCLFYAAWNWKFLIVMFISITTDYFCSKFMDREVSEKKRKLFLFLSLTVNFSILFFFKYFNFFAENTLDLLKFFHLTDPSLKWFLNIILPVGISFYTFEAVSYVVDVYRRQTKPAKSYWDYILFVIYFPHLIAGPIMRAKNFLPQVSNPRIISISQFLEGCGLFAWGLFEKVFVADNMGKIVNPVFASAAPYDGARVLIALYAFSFQILCDFDGYSTMARGLGKMMGFDITINFKYPYFAANPREFWQRWHISLSTWLRDYLYVPLGGNRRGRANTYKNLLLTMILGGVWHGAAWTFVLWGFFHGTILAIHRWISERALIKSNSWRIPRSVKIIFFFHVVLISWLLFRAQTAEQVLEMIVGILFHFRIDKSVLTLFAQFLFYAVPFLVVQWIQFRRDDLLALFKQHWLVQPIAYAAFTYLFVMWGAKRPETFLYFQF